MLGGLIWPVLAVASVVSLPAIYLFFGDQWLEAAPYASLIAWWAIFRMVHWFSSDLLMARGFEKVMVIKEAVVFFAHRSEEHTSELQSRPHLVCRLLLEKKK